MNANPSPQAREVHHYMGGKPAQGQSKRFGDVFNPNTGKVAARVNLASVADVGRVVEDAAAAFPVWADTPAPRRAQIMFNFRAICSRSGEFSIVAIVSNNRSNSGFL